MNRNIYITTTIPYVNSTPHVGFALELVQADALTRYHRLCGHSVRLQTGTDENALKNVLAAEAAAVGVEDFVTGNAEAFRALAEALNIDVDRFLRTTEPRHRAGVHWFWNKLRPGDLYKTSYEGRYCSGCEDFFLEKDLIEGCCPVHTRPPDLVAEENYFFRLSAYQQTIEEVLSSGRVRVIPEAKRNEVLNFVRSGLRDFSVTRSVKRAHGWGIPVPGDDTQIIYVWLDALVNYLSGLGFGSGEEAANYWRQDARKIHILGKDVWKFHAVYWPAFLLSAGLPLPDEIVVHGFLTVNGRKISKSLGNAIDPRAAIATYGVDAVRYYLLRAVSPFEDGDFSYERLHHVYHADLANGLGNLVSRLCRLREKAGLGGLTESSAPSAPVGYHEAWSEYCYEDALAALWDGVTRINRDIEYVRPWERLATPGDIVLREKLDEWFAALRVIAYWLQPFLPETGALIIELTGHGRSVHPPPLFPRIAGADA